MSLVLKRSLHVVLFLVIVTTFSHSASVAQTTEPAMYHEAFRPQFHFSPVCGWMNDPNGMVYYEGEYHLFYQYHPDDIVWGPMHWGHAVSRDLIQWENLPIALYPDAIGPIWSGSAVVDAQNTSGLVPGGGLIAIFSYQDQSQGIAYSTDKGRTWTMYAGNPVIPALAKDFRDPKVFWHEATGKWVMIIAAGNQIQLFTSPNLIDWEFASSLSGDIRGGVWEVPDLFPLDLDGKTYWVMLASVSQMAPAGGGGVRYMIGDFDGTTFTYDRTNFDLWLDYGPDNYAGTTWSDMPDGQRVYIGWMSNWLYANATPTERWRGATTLPRTLRLMQTADGVRLAQQPVDSIAQLRGESLGTWENVALEGELPLDSVQGRLLEIIAEFRPGSAERFGLDVHAGDNTKTRILFNNPQSKLFISRSDQTATGFIPNFTRAFGSHALTLEDGLLRVHLFVDESSVEVFAQDGLVSISSLSFVNPQHDGVSLFAENGDAQLNRLEIYALNSLVPTGNNEMSACS